MKLFFSAISAMALCASCAPSTPQARIEKNPEKFAKLSPAQKSLVREGNISRGMPPEGVELAWGRPNQLSEGSRNGKYTLRWDYEGSKPVYTNNFFGGIGLGYGYGRYGRSPYYSTYGVGLVPDITYVPYTRASVWFTGNKVDSWERQK